MGAMQVERLMVEIAGDRVRPERYSRKAFGARIEPVALVSALAIGAVASGIVLGRL